MPQELSAAVAAEVRRLLADRGWSGRELARRSGLGVNAVAVKLRGDSTPFDTRDLAAVAKSLETTVTALVSAAEASASDG